MPDLPASVAEQLGVGLEREYHPPPGEHRRAALEKTPNTLTLVVAAREEALLELTDVEMQAIRGGSPISTVSNRRLACQGMGVKAYLNGSHFSYRDVS
jgi:hypothetical protein